MTRTLRPIRSQSFWLTILSIFFVSVPTLATTHGLAVGWQGDISKFVVRLTLSAADFKIFCTGTLISNTEVLTAGHCLLGQIRPFVAAGNVYAEISDPTSPVGYRRIQLDPNPSARFAGHLDIAVARLVADAGLGNVTFPPLATAPCAKPKILYSFGFGLDQNNQVSSEPKMSIYHEVEGNEEFLAGESPSHELGRNCFGDSGGPVICEQYGRPVIASVNSKISGGLVAMLGYLFGNLTRGQLCERFDTISGTRISTHRKLISKLRAN